MKRYFAVFLAVVVAAIMVLPCAATEMTAEMPTEAETEVVIVESKVVTEEISVELTEALKEVLIILADSDSKSEAVDRIVESNVSPNATAGEISDLVDSFIEMSKNWDCKECFVYDMTEGLQYGLDEAWLEEYWHTYFPDMPVSCEQDIAEDVIDALEGATNKTEAIFAVAQKLGVTTDEAEKIVNSVIEYGDEYFGDASWWSTLKSDVRENMTFWVTVIVAIAAILAIAGGVFVLIGKINPTMRRALFGVEDVLKTAKAQSTDVSATLNSIKESAKVAFDLLADKSVVIEALTEEIKQLYTANEKERKSMVAAELYNLQILKLICSRTALPLADKAAVDLWYTKAIDSLKSELSPEDIEKMESIAAVLEVNNGEKV